MPLLAFVGQWAITRAHVTSIGNHHNTPGEPLFSIRPLGRRIAAVATTVALAAGGLALASAPAHAVDDIWQSLGGGLGQYDYKINTMLVDGPDLYVGGVFTTIGGVTARSIARWDGTTWHALIANGESAPGVFGEVRALAHAPGGGILVGGDFNGAGDGPGQNLVKWDGTSWSEFHGGTNREVNDILVAPDDSVYITGNFGYVGVTLQASTAVEKIAKWDGSAWSALGGGLTSTASCPCQGASLALDGTDLYVGGTFTNAGSVVSAGIAKWNGSAWSAVGGGLGLQGQSNDAPDVTTVYVDSNHLLYVGGNFRKYTPFPLYNLVTWDGTSWADLGDGIQCNYETCVSDIEPYGTGILVTGGFSFAGPLQANGVAAWDGTDWSYFGSTPQRGVVPGMNSYAYAGVEYGSQIVVAGVFSATGDYTLGTKGIAAYGPPPAVAPSMTGVSVTGTPDVGQTLTASATGLAGSPTPTVSYRWQKQVNSSWVDISGANTAAWQVTAAVQGLNIRAVATATNGIGSDAESQSSPLAIPGPPGTAPAIGSTTVSGTAKVGQKLTAATSGVTGSPTPTVAYRWQSAVGGTWTDIPGANTKNYTVPVSMAGVKIRAMATATNSVSSVSKASAAKTVAEIVPPTAPGDVKSSVKGRAITLTWTKSTSELPILKYQGYCSQGDTTVRAETANAKATSVVVTVTAAGVWNCRVAPVTEVGRGTGSERERVTVK